MTKFKVRAALASVLGFKPVKTIKLKLLVISVPVLLWGLFPIGLFYLNFLTLQINSHFLLDVLYPNRHLLHVVESEHLYIVNLKIALDHES